MPVEFEQGCVKLARYTRCMHGRHDSHLSGRGVTLSSQAFLVRRHFWIGTYRGPPPPELNPIVQTLTGMQREGESLSSGRRAKTLFHVRKPKQALLERLEHDQRSVQWLKSVTLTRSLQTPFHGLITLVKYHLSAESKHLPVSSRPSKGFNGKRDHCARSNLLAPLQRMSQRLLEIHMLWNQNSAIWARNISPLKKFSAVARIREGAICIFNAFGDRAGEQRRRRHPPP